MWRAATIPCPISATGLRFPAFDCGGLESLPIASGGIHGWGKWVMGKPRWQD